MIFLLMQIGFVAVVHDCFGWQDGRGFAEQVAVQFAIFLKPLPFFQKFDSKFLVTQNGKEQVVYLFEVLTVGIELFRVFGIILFQEGNRFFQQTCFLRSEFFLFLDQLVVLIPRSADAVGTVSIGNAHERFAEVGQFFHGLSRGQQLAQQVGRRTVPHSDQQ